MRNAIVITSPHIPPSLNNIYVNVPGKGRVKSSRYRTWKTAAGWDVKLARIVQIGGPVHLSIIVEKPRGVRSDISNRIKPLEDLLTDMDVLVDDSQVMKVSAEWGDIKGFRVEIMEVEAI